MRGGREVGATAGGLGHPVELHEIAAEGCARPAQDILGDRRGAIGDRLELRISAAVRIGLKQHHLDHRGGEEGVRDIFLAQHPHRVGSCKILHQHQPSALREPRETNVRPRDVEQGHDDHHRLVLAISEAVDLGRRFEESAIIGVGQHDALGQPGRAAGVELKHIVGELRRVGERRVGCAAKPRVERLERRMFAVERDQARRRGQIGHRRERAVEEILADEEQLRPGIAEDEADFGGCEAAVDRREAGACARGAEEERIPAVVVLGERRHAVAGRNARCDQSVSDAVRARVEFGETRLARPELHCGRAPPHFRLCRRNVRQRPDGLQIDHFALPTVVST